MSNVAAGLASFGILLALLAVRVPIGVAMLAVGVGGFIWIQGLTPLLSFLKTTPFETFSTYSFSVIPLFLLMGNVASSTGLSARLFRGANHRRWPRGWLVEMPHRRVPRSAPRPKLIRHTGRQLNPVAIPGRRWAQQLLIGQFSDRLGHKGKPGLLPDHGRTNGFAMST